MAIDDSGIDFEAAETYLQQARKAHGEGDRSLFVAARKLVTLALGLGDQPPTILHTRHLKN
jgi:hypothetical protein